MGSVANKVEALLWLLWEIIKPQKVSNKEPRLVKSVPSTSIQSGFQLYIFWHGLVTNERKFLRNNELKEVLDSRDLISGS